MEEKKENDKINARKKINWTYIKITICGNNHDETLFTMKNYKKNNLTRGTKEIDTRSEGIS